MIQSGGRSQSGCGNRSGTERLHLCLAVTVVMLLANAAALAQVRAAAVSDRQRAVDDALQELFQEVGRLRLTTGQPLGAVLARSATDEEAVRLAILEKHRAWRAYRQSRGELEVDAWLSVSDLSTILADIVQYRFKSSRLSLPVNVTWARSNPPAIPATGRYLPTTGLKDESAGWRHCSPRQVAMAKQAAVSDARVAILDRIARCPVAGKRELGFVLQSDRSIQQELRELLRQAPVDEPTLEPTGVCRAKVELAQAEVLRLLQEAAKATDGRVRREQLKPSDPASLPPVFSAEGFAVAPPAPSMYAPPRKRGRDPEQPEWAGRFLVVQGGGRAPVDMQDQPGRRAWAERAARIEASRQIWMQIEDLPLPQGETIGIRLSRDFKVASVLAGLDRFIAQTGAPVVAEDGTTTVSVGVHLQIVWRMLSGLDQSR
jgi:hypothetical protein